jgi:hypothetical protein
MIKTYTGFSKQEGFNSKPDRSPNVNIEIKELLKFQNITKHLLNSTFNLPKTSVKNSNTPILIDLKIVDSFQSPNKTRRSL